MRLKYLRYALWVALLSAHLYLSYRALGSVWQWKSSQLQLIVWMELLAVFVMLEYIVYKRK